MQYDIVDMNKIINMMNVLEKVTIQMQMAENYKIFKILVLNLY
jgi:hypothetical protein